MLYLVKDSRNNKTLIKIGITNNLKVRREQYKTCNPYAKFLQSAFAPDNMTDRQAEKICHEYLLSQGYKRVDNTEWFIIPKKQKNYFFEDIQNNYSNILLPFNYIQKI